MVPIMRYRRDDDSSCGGSPDVTPDASAARTQIVCPDCLFDHDARRLLAYRPSGSPFGLVAFVLVTCQGLSHGGGCRVSGIRPVADSLGVSLIAVCALLRG